MTPVDVAAPSSHGVECAHGSTPRAQSHAKIAWAEHRRLRRWAALWAIIAAGALSLVYLGVLGLANSLEHAMGEFVRLWPWMTTLLAGFSLQVGLFAYARIATRGSHDARARGVAASGGTSTLSMVACCAHHLTDVLPAMGLAGAAVFLAMYQTLFLLMGVLSNLVGAVYMLGLIRRHGLYPAKASVLSLSVRWPVHRAVPYVLGAAIFAFSVAVLVAVR